MLCALPSIREHFENGSRSVPCDTMGNRLNFYLNGLNQFLDFITLIIIRLSIKQKSKVVASQLSFACIAACSQFSFCRRTKLYNNKTVTRTFLSPSIGALHFV